MTARGEASPDLGALAGRLEPRHRSALLGAQALYPGGWFYRLGSARGTIPLGLGVRTIDGVALTPLGLALRTHPQENAHDQD